jgi:hypothetical protein
MSEQKNRLIYLATPYSHRDPVVRERRFKEACRIAAHFISEGWLVFCPIAHGHPIAVAGENVGTCWLPKNWDYWQKFDCKMLSACDELWIVMMDGWEESKGIDGEIDMAADLKKPIRFIGVSAL